MILFTENASSFSIQYKCFSDIIFLIIMAVAALMDAMNVVAQKRHAKVLPEKIKIEGKPFTEYVIQQKRLWGLSKKTLARAYFENGFDNETGEYENIIIAKLPEIPDEEFAALKRTINIPVDIIDYETAKKHNFNRRLGGPY
jgi:hypothetical protein